ncbi:MAG TPA: isochorismatase family protein [Polyangiaceae bacterium]|nr:isochorismatase family protein [Polyangiaceae bacterium]
MKTALLLIDVQESFRARPYWSAEELPRFLDRTRALVEGSVARDVPIVRILHEDEPASASNPFSRASGLVRPLEGLVEVAPALDIVKGRHSALAGTGLSIWLRRHGVGRVIVSGIRTEQCCETTTRHASDEGFEVDFVTEATLTFDMRYPDGRPLPARDVVARTEAVLAERFATLCSVESALERAR